jgi:hypothetical protein
MLIDDVELGTTGEGEFQLINCSFTDELRVDQATLLAIDGAEPAVFAFLEVPATPIQLAPQQSLFMTVVFTPDAPRAQHDAVLQVATNSTIVPELSANIVGHEAGVGIPECVEVRLTCTVRGSADAPARELAADLLSTIDCVATSVVGDEIEGLNYRWTLDPPSTSSSSWRSASGSDNSFFVDSVGTYLAYVEAIVGETQLNCGVTQVEVMSRYTETLVVELTWETPGDPDRDDTGAGAGSDLDIHLLRRGRTCWNGVDDCHWRNKRPDWGVFGEQSDDPDFGVEDNDGWGPEGVRLSQVAEDTTYSVGVEYFNDWNFGPSNARVRVYVRGELILDAERVLEHTDETAKDFWHVADIDGVTLQVELVDEVYPAIAAAQCERVP